MVHLMLDIMVAIKHSNMRWLGLTNLVSRTVTRCKSRAVRVSCGGEALGLDIIWFTSCYRTSIFHGTQWCLLLFSCSVQLGELPLLIEKTSEAIKGEGDLNVQAAVSSLISVLFALLSRLLAIIIFAYVFKSYILLILWLDSLQMSLVLIVTDYRWQTWTVAIV